MIVYRIASQRYARDLSGRGAELYGGRWNPRGTPMIYAATTRALAYLELLVHVQVDALPLHMAILSIELPDEAIISAPSLKATWSQDVRYTQGIGSAFLQDRPASDQEQSLKPATPIDSVLAMHVPSVIIPEEHNVVINPLHPHAHLLRITDINDLHIDPRLTRSAAKQ